MITGPLKRHAGISATVAIVFAIVAVPVIVAVIFYAVPEAWDAAIKSGDLLTFLGVVLFAAVVIAWFAAPSIVASIDAAHKYSTALEMDKHTRQDDRATYTDEDGKAHPGTLTFASDKGYNGLGPGIYRLDRGKYRKIGEFSQTELEQRRVANEGGFVGYNEAWNSRD